MDSCITTQQTNSALAQYDQEAANQDFREGLISDFRQSILTGEIVKIGNSSYSFDDVMSEVAGDPRLDGLLQLLLINDASKGGLDDEFGGKAIRCALNPILDSLLNDMADCQISLLESQEKEVNDYDLAG